VWLPPAPAWLACRGMLAPDGASASPPSPETGVVGGQPDRRRRARPVLRSRTRRRLAMMARAEATPSPHQSPVDRTRKGWWGGSSERRSFRMGRRRWVGADGGAQGPALLCPRRRRHGEPSSPLSLRARRASRRQLEGAPVQPPPRGKGGSSEPSPERRTATGEPCRRRRGQGSAGPCAPPSAPASRGRRSRMMRATRPSRSGRGRGRRSRGWCRGGCGRRRGRPG
jgi:hypothetical protein